MPSTSAAAADKRPARKAEPATLPAEGYAKLPAILAVLPIGKTTWLEGVRSGRFPKPIHLGRSVFWKVADIRRVIADIEAGTLPQPKAKPKSQAKAAGSHKGAGHA